MADQSPSVPLGSSLTIEDIELHLKSRPHKINRVARFLFTKYHEFLDLRDIENASLESRIEQTLTRALAAHAIAHFAGKSPQDAAANVVDGGQDLGIDAIAFDEAEQILFFCQSKFSQSGHGNIATDDISKYVRGVFDLLAKNTSHANKKIRSTMEAIDQLEHDVNCRYVVVVASTSESPLSPDMEKYLVGKFAEQDPIDEGIFTVENFSLKKVLDSVAKGYSPTSITLSLSLENWGCVKEPFTAFYGQIPVAEILKWRIHGRQLFSKNLRSFIPLSEVTRSITETLRSNSDLFWYFNNGAIILCNEINLHGPYSSSASRAVGNFLCKGVSVVNGAQTIGTIWQLPDDGASLDPNAKMLVRLISLHDAPRDFADQVTQATNTQKPILPRDFAALDIKQRQLAMEFQQDGRAYVFRQGDPLPDNTIGTSLEELALMLACRMSTDLATIAYSKPGLLMDRDAVQYQTIFHDPKLPPTVTLWKLMRIFRASDHVLSKHKIKSESKKHSLIAKHAFRLVQHRVLNDGTMLSLLQFHSLSTDELRRDVAQATENHFASVAHAFVSNFGPEVIQTFFKNASKVRRLNNILNGIEESLPPRPKQMDLFTDADIANQE